MRPMFNTVLSYLMLNEVVLSHLSSKSLSADFPRLPGVPGLEWPRARTENAENTNATSLLPLVPLLQPVARPRQREHLTR